MKKKILVTGANGHLGCNTVRALLTKGYAVKAFVRKTSDLIGLKDLPLTFCYGDVRDRTALLEAAKDCEVIIHHAAVYKIWAKTAEEIIQPAVEGTKNIFEVGAASGIQRIIFTSSTYAIGPSDHPDIVRTEKDWNEHENLPYAIAKTKSEKIAWELADKHKLPMISLCPAAVFGRYDYKVTPSNRMVLDMLKGMGITVEGLLSCIDVRDVGEIHALAVEKGNTGERYILTGNNIRMRELGEMVNKLTGIRVPHLPFNRSTNIAMGKMMELLAKTTGWDPPLTAGLAREYSHRFAQFDNSKMIKDFNYTPYSFEETIHDTIRWFLYLNKAKLNGRRSGNKVADKFEPDTEWIAGV